MSDSDVKRQMAEAEDILGDRLQQSSFVKRLFFGQCLDSQLPAYPQRVAEETSGRVADLQHFCRDHIDAVAIDRNERIPDEVVSGLGRMGILGACLPKDCGGLALDQSDYCRLLEVLGGHCGSTALFVNAHHSIGPRAIVLFGTEAQKSHYLPKLASGQWISAFALTEPEAGSDAANVQTRATPAEDGTGFILNGEKRWITNGGIADVLTVMARTPMPETGETKITAFIVTPDMPGFEVVEERMAKCGVRGTATSRLAFHDMFVPRENVLGPLGSGLKIALTVLDFGRTTFGASCTGAAKFCVRSATRHANTRVQFGQTLGSFELVKQKLAKMQADTYAMEACTYQTAAIIDAGASDFMLETAILKVFSTDALWRIVNDTIQIYGGKAYFTDEPYERMMRDARINLIGEGANDVLRAFFALVGMRDVGLELQSLVESLKNPFKAVPAVARFVGRMLSSRLAPPEVNVSSPELEGEARLLGNDIARFARKVERLLGKYREEVIEQQHQAGRIADAVMELYVSACVLRRLDRALQDNREPKEIELATGRYFLAKSRRNISGALRELRHNDDSQINTLANRML